MPPRSRSTSGRSGSTSPTSSSSATAWTTPRSTAACASSAPWPRTSTAEPAAPAPTSARTSRACSSAPSTTGERNTGDTGLVASVYPSRPVCPPGGRRDDEQEGRGASPAPTWTSSASSDPAVLGPRPSSSVMLTVFSFDGNGGFTTHRHVPGREAHHRQEGRDGESSTTENVLDARPQAGPDLHRRRTTSRTPPRCRPTTSTPGPSSSSTRSTANLPERLHRQDRRATAAFWPCFVSFFPVIILSACSGSS